MPTRKPDTVASLFLETERYLVDSTKDIPLSAPISVQVTETIIALRRAALAFLQFRADAQLPVLHGRDAISAYLGVCQDAKIGVTDYAQPFRRLVNKGVLLNDKFDNRLSALRMAEVTL